SAGSDDRLLRFVERCRPVDGCLGSVSGSGKTDRSCEPVRCAPDTVSRPRWYGRSRGWSGQPGHTLATPGLSEWQLPDHRAGRDDPLQIWLAEAGGAEPDALYHGGD